MVVIGPENDEIEGGRNGKDNHGDAAIGVPIVARDGADQDADRRSGRQSRVPRKFPGSRLELGWDAEQERDRAVRVGRTNRTFIREPG